MNLVKLGDFKKIKLVFAEFLLKIPNEFVIALSFEILKILLLTVTHFDYQKESEIISFVQKFN